MRVRHSLSSFLLVLVKHFKKTIINRFFSLTYQALRSWIKEKTNLFSLELWGSLSLAVMSLLRKRYDMITLLTITWRSQSSRGEASHNS